MPSKLTVSRNTSRPANLRTRVSGDQLYPFSDMRAKDDYFEVPKQMYFGDAPYDESRYDAKKHRARVNNAVRSFALKQNKAASQVEGFDKDNFIPMRFVVAIVDAGVGVWRDA